MELKRYERQCSFCSGIIKVFMRFTNKRQLWICNRCKKVFVQDANGVMHENDIEQFYPKRLFKALKAETGKRVE